VAEVARNRQQPAAPEPPSMPDAAASCQRQSEPLALVSPPVTQIVTPARFERATPASGEQRGAVRDRQLRKG
jgi:hypothetical protein